MLNAHKMIKILYTLFFKAISNIAMTVNMVAQKRERERKSRNERKKRFRYQRVFLETRRDFL